VCADHEFPRYHDIVAARAAQAARVPGIEDFDVGTPQEHHARLRDARLQHARLAVFLDGAAQG